MENMRDIQTEHERIMEQLDEAYNNGDVDGLTELAKQLSLLAEKIIKMNT